MAVHGHVSAIRSKKGRMEVLRRETFVLFDITTDAKKLAVLLSVSGSDTFELGTKRQKF